MKTITIVVDVDGNSVSREFTYDKYNEETWGARILDMLETIEKSKEVKF